MSDGENQPPPEENSQPPAPDGNAPVTDPDKKPPEHDYQVAGGPVSLKPIQARWSVYRCGHCGKTLLEFPAATPPIRHEIKPCDCWQSDQYRKSIPGSSGSVKLDEEIRPDRGELKKA